jgi:hypothetical protein
MMNNYAMDVIHGMVFMWKVGPNNSVCNAYFLDLVFSQWFTYIKIRIFDMFYKNLIFYSSYVHA